MLPNLPRGHPSGAFTPCDWQAPGRTIPDRFAEIADEFPERLATYDFTRRLTYAELEPSFPLARARQIIADTKATVILAESEHLALARELVAPAHRIIDLDAVTTGDERRPKTRIEPDAIALFIPEESGGQTTTDSLGWSRWSQGAIRVHRLAGGHTDLIKPPIVDDLAARLQACIDLAGAA